MVQTQYELADSFDFFEDFDKRADLVFTSFPDPEELNMEVKGLDDFRKYVEFMRDAVGLINNVVSETGFVVLVLTDRKAGGSILLKHAEAGRLMMERGFTLKDYKILVKDDADKVRIYRLNFSHVLIWSKEGKIPVEKRKGDYLKDVWTFPVFKENCFSVKFARFVVKQFSEPGQLVVDPFAGRGTVSYAAEKLGRNSISCEINESIYNKDFIFNEDDGSFKQTKLV